MSNYWTINSYCNPTWDYTELPTVGDTIRYMRDGYTSTVKCVHWNHICMNDSIVFRRRVQLDRIWAWINKHITTITTRPVGTTVGVNSTVTTNTMRRPMRPLRPVTPYVEVVDLVL